MTTPDDHVRVRGDFDSPSRWLWLVKWCVLAVPHYPILILLYLVYPPLTLVAGVCILFTGRYPRPIFDFNVGVLRWSWRVMNFRFPMNSTDKYPPFTLASRPDYPGDLQVDYPEQLANWAVLTHIVCFDPTIGVGRLTVHSIYSLFPLSFDWLKYEENDFLRKILSRIGIGCFVQDQSVRRRRCINEILKTSYIVYGDSRGAGRLSFSSFAHSP